MKNAELQKIKDEMKTFSSEAPKIKRPQQDGQAVFSRVSTFLALKRQPRTGAVVL
jgi:hypothetical protein